MYGRSCAAALSYVSTCNARQVCSACREQERIKALPKKSVQLNTPRPHKTRSELNSESSLRRRPNRECRHERRSPPGARPSAPPRRQARPGRRALADGGPRPPRRGRRSRELGATHPRADGPVHPSCLRRRVGRAYTFASATPHDTDVVGPPRKNAKWRKDSHVRHFLNPDDYCGSVRADGVYTHYRRRHDPLLHGTNSRALRVDRLDRTINSYTCPARGGLEAPAYKRLTRQ